MEIIRFRYHDELKIRLYSLAFFILILSLSLVVNPSTYAFAIPKNNGEGYVPHFPLRVILLDEYKNDSKVYRTIRVEDETIVLYRISWDRIDSDTWMDTHGNVKKFDGFWIALVTEDAPDAHIYLDISYAKYQEIISSGYDLVFISDFNGTHFREAILLANDTSRGVYNIIYYGENYKNEYYCFSQDHNITTEFNRTEIIGTVASKYNPSLALYVACKYLKVRNFTYDYTMNIFLVPSIFLDDNTTEFVWNFAFIKVINFFKKHFIVYHFVINPYGEVLDFKMFEIKDGRVEPIYFIFHASLITLIIKILAVVLFLLSPKIISMCIESYKRRYKHKSS